MKKRANAAENREIDPDAIPTLSLRENSERLYVLPDNAQHMGSREEQQDYFAYSDLMNAAQLDTIGCAAVLADGMGGMQNGREAAVSGVDQFLAQYQTAMEAGDSISQALEHALLAANRAVTQIPGAGATLIGVVVKDNALHWISVGDSHIYLFRKGLLRQLNTDHVYARELDALCSQGKITPAQAANHPERKALTSYLGVDPLPLIDRSPEPYPLRMGDILLLCSDGVYGVLSDREMAMVLGSGTENQAEQLVAAALAKGVPSQDNATAILLKMI